MGIHGIEPGMLSLKPLSSQIDDLFLFGCKSILSDSLVRHVEILVESLRIRDEVSRHWVWPEDFRRVYILVKVSNSLLQAEVFDALLIFHCGAGRPSARGNIVEVCHLLAL